MMRILVDTREQAPLDFSPYDCVVERRTLRTGDYTLDNAEEVCAIERKSLCDLVACCMGKNRDRFERELSRAGNVDTFYVVVEAAMHDVRNHLYRSRMQPHAVLQSVLAFQVRYGVPFIWAGCRRGAAYVTYWTLEKHARQLETATL